MADVIEISADEFLSACEEAIFSTTGEQQQNCIEALFDFTNLLDENQ
jgi:hypothetical protein